MQRFFLLALYHYIIPQHHPINRKQWKKKIS
jgi:hypothetical protein